MDENSIKKKQILFSQIELNHDVQNWKFEGVDYWPILKNIIYFRDRKFSNNFFINFINSPISLSKKIIHKLKNKLIISSKKESKIELKRTDVIFSGAITHRVFHRNEFFNKYFDPIMDTIEESFTSQIFEYSKIDDSKKYYKANRVYDLFSIYNKSNKLVKIDFQSDDNLIQNIKLVSGLFFLNENKLQNEFFIKLKSIIIWKNVWLEIIDHCKPKILFGLCYYNEPMYGMLLAGFEKNIPTIDMQHGGQGSLHPAYTFHSLEKGYNTLPKYFWLWDKNSYTHLSSFLNSNNHSLVLGGNPWIDFVSNQNEKVDLDLSKKNIICTLTLGSDNLIPNYLFEAIKASTDEYLWYLRWHPRTSEIDKKNAISTLKNKKLLHKTNINDANSYNLPTLLKSAFAHISHSSGSIAEADTLNVPYNIVTSELGCINYKYLIENNRLIYFNPDINSNLFTFVSELKSHKNTFEEICNVKNYLNIIYEIIKKN